MNENQKLILERVGNEVHCNGKKVTIVKQASKGENKEVVKIEGLPGSNGQKYISLSKLKQGKNEFECAAKATTSTSKPSKVEYILTKEEQEKVNKLQSEIDAIIEEAKARFVPSPDLNCDPTQMSEEERLAKAAELEKWLAMLKA